MARGHMYGIRANTLNHPHTDDNCGVIMLTLISM